MNSFESIKRGRGNRKRNMIGTKIEKKINWQSNISTLLYSVVNYT